MGKQGGPGDIEGNLDHRNVVDNGGYNGKGCRMDGTTSGAHRDSNRVKRELLAENGTDQCQRYKNDTTDIPRPSMAQMTIDNLPTTSNPPHCCARAGLVQVWTWRKFFKTCHMTVAAGGRSFKYPRRFCTKI